jgi:hypothetical protein
MAVKKSGENQAPPKSEMIRVPTALIPMVRQLSKLHRQGYTIALLQELEEVLTKFDSNNDISTTAASKQVLHLEERLEKLESHLTNKGDLVETKLEVIAKKLELLERAISSNRYNTQAKPRKQAYPYQQPKIDLQPFPNENLAQRLGVNPQSLVAERENKSAKEFLRWSRNRDPMHVGWEWNASDKLYHPIK